MKFIKIVSLAALLAANPVFANNGNIENKVNLNQITLDAVSRTSADIQSALQIAIKQNTKFDLLMVTSFKHNPASLVAREIDSKDNTDAALAE